MQSNKQFLWHHFDNSEAVADAVYKQIALISRQRIDENKEFKLVLAGGTTPGIIYQKLVDLKTDWSKWQIYFGDERCLDIDDIQRNSSMASINWLSKVAIPDENIHFIPAQLGAKKAAQLYRTQVDSALPFDLVLSGMGEDGHTASLFPGQQHKSDQSVLEIHNSPKPPSDRVSLSLAALSATRRSFVIITGSSKFQAVKDWQNGNILPVNRLSCQGEKKVDVYIDQSALTGN